MTAYRFVAADSDVLIHARSSVHPIDGRATELSGTIEADVVDGGIFGVFGGALEVPVRQLRSGNPLYDAELQRRVEARRYPTITGTVRAVKPLHREGIFHVEGDLTFHGVTRAVAGELRIAVDGDRLLIEGAHVFDVRDFGIKPPRILMLRVEPKVKVDIRLVAEPL